MLLVNQFKIISYALLIGRPLHGMGTYEPVLKITNIFIVKE